MTPDIRTAAQREAADTVALTIGEDSARAQGFTFSCTNGCTEMHAHSQGVVLGFTEGAVWGAARVTPTREQIAEACEKYLDSRFTDPTHPQLEYVVEDSYGCADAILVLMQGLAEGERIGTCQ